MSEQLQPSAGDEQEAASSGLLLSVEPLKGTANYKLSSDDTDAGSDTTDVSGSDADSSDASDSDSSDASDRDKGGSGDADSSDESDADGTDAADADGTDTGADADGTDPLGIASDGTDAK